MSAKRPSFKTLERRAPAEPEPLASAPVEISASAPVRKQANRDGKKAVTVYLSASVWRSAKQLALDHDLTLDALMREGLDLAFAKYGVNRGAADA